MIKLLLSIAVLVLMGCSHNPQPLGKPLPKLSYAHLNPMAVHGGTVRIQQSFRPTQVQQETLNQFALTPAEVLKSYANKRFLRSRDTGHAEKLVFDVQDASVTKVSDEENLIGLLSGKGEDIFIVDVLIHMTPVRNDGHRAAPFKVAHKQKLSLPQNISVAEREFRQFEAIEKMMNSIDKKIIEMVQYEMTPEYF